MAKIICGEDCHPVRLVYALTVAFDSVVKRLNDDGVGDNDLENIGAFLSETHDRSVKIGSHKLGWTIFSVESLLKIDWEDFRAHLQNFE